MASFLVLVSFSNTTVITTNQTFYLSLSTKVHYHGTTEFLLMLAWEKNLTGSRKSFNLHNEFSFRSLSCQYFSSSTAQLSKRCQLLFFSN